MITNNSQIQRSYISWETWYPSKRPLSPTASGSYPPKAPQRDLHHQMSLVHEEQLSFVLFILDTPPPLLLSNRTQMDVIITMINVRMLCCFSTLCTLYVMKLLTCYHYYHASKCVCIHACSSTSFEFLVWIKHFPTHVNPCPAPSQQYM